MKLHMTRSSMVLDMKQALDTNKLKETCKGMGIDLERMSEQQLESAYAMQGFKATHTRTKNICFIFLSLLSERSVLTVGFFNGSKILQLQCRGEREIAEMIGQCLSSQQAKADHGIEREYQKIQKMFEDLNRTSDKIIKKSNNEIMAMQEIKSSNEYMTICNHTKMLSLQVQELCKTVKARERKAQKRNAEMMEKMLQLERVKVGLEEENIKYEEMRNKLGDISEYLKQFITKKKNALQGRDFYDEDSFMRYLDDLTQLKKLENQRKFLAND